MNLDSYAKGRTFGLTISEWIDSVPGGLPRDAVGMWEIIPDGRYEYGLSGDALTEFVSRCVSALLAAGAKPVVGGAGTEYDWLYQPQYGESNEEIRDAVMKEWLAAGSPDCDPGDLWFALPSPYVGNRE